MPPPSRRPGASALGPLPPCDPADYGFFRLRVPAPPPFQGMWSYRVVQGWLEAAPAGAPRGSRWVRTDEGDEGGGGELVQVPPGARRQPVTVQWMRELLPRCQRRVDTARLEAAGAVEAGAWVDAARPRYVTLADVAAWPPGRPVKLLVLDRNWGDVAMEERNNPRGRAIPARRFFRGSVVTFVPSAASPVHGDMRHAGDAGDPPTNFQPTDLHVEYRRSAWYPLDDDGTLPASDPQGVLPLLGRRVPWRRLPQDTPVGWRGPMLRWDDVPAADRVYWA